MTTKNARTHRISRINSPANNWQKDAEAAAVIDCFPWGAQAEVDYRPVSGAYLATDGKTLFAFMETDETNVRAQTRGFGFVHTDSCMEFFLQPDTNDPRYLNWEFNPAGAMYLSIGTSRYNREKLARDNYREFFQVKTETHLGGWNLAFSIPLLFLHNFFPAFAPEKGHVMRGNFYKCGDNTAHPHYGCWSPINLPQPDFHCPDFFGELIL